LRDTLHAKAIEYKYVVKWVEHTLIAYSTYCGTKELSGYVLRLDTVSKAIKNTLSIYQVALGVLQ
jgi:fumarate hydratase class II